MKIENITPKEIKVIPFKEKVVVPPNEMGERIGGADLYADNTAKFKETTANGKTIIVDVGQDIQSAIDDVHSYGSGSVVLKQGTHSLTSDLTLYSNIYLQGESAGSSIIDFSNGSYGLIGASNIYIQNLTLQNSTKNGMIILSGLSDVVIKDCSFKNCSGIHINTTGSLRTTLSHCSFINTTRGSSYGIKGTTSKTILSVDNCYFENLGYAVALVDGIIIGCEIYNCDYGIYDSWDRLTIEGNLIHYCDSWAIYDGHSMLIVGNSLFLNGNITNGGQIQITFNSGNGVAITGNIFRNSLGKVIYLNNNVTFVTISGNSVYETSNDNREIVYIYNSSSNTVVGNTFKGYANYNGIYLDASDDNIISGNRITVCGQYGINISNSTCDKNIVTSNQLLGNTVGALNDSGTSTTVANNITV